MYDGRVRLMRTLMGVLFAGGGALLQAQVPVAVPSTYTSLYQQVQSNIAAFNSMLPSNPPPSKTLWSSDLLLSNANLGLQLLAPNREQSRMAELARLKSLGVTAVTVTMGFPVMDQDFYTFNGDPQDFQSMVAVYQDLANAIHQDGLKMIVESAILFPGFFSANSGFNLSGYYASFPNTTDGDNNFIAARVRNILTIAQQIHPDYINLNSEPDTEESLSGRASLYGTPQAYASTNDSIVTQLHAQGVTIPLGAGIGTWLADGSEWVQDLLATHIDYLDLHVYPTVNNALPDAITYADMAKSAGKPVAISEAWDYKESSTESSSVASAPSFYARDVFSFWSPVDIAFIQAFMRYANWKNLTYLSPEWSRYFWAYLNYNQEAETDNASYSMNTTIAGSVLSDESFAAMQALNNNAPPTATGLAYQAAIAAQTGQAVTTTSAADYASPVAPNSIVSLFATNIVPAGTVVAALSPPPAPLPTSLAGASATITDASGHSAPFGLIVVTQYQADALVPAGLQAGPATVHLTTSSGTQLSSAVTLASVAPSIFTSDQSGGGVAAAQVVTAHANGTQTFQGSIATCTSNGCVPIPVSLGSSTDQVVLELFGTGIRGAGGASAVTVTIGGIPCQVQYAGAQGNGAPGSYYGLDQVNVLLPRGLAGMGTVNLILTAAGQQANTVTVAIQ